jgi:hypothetical protein
MSYLPNLHIHFSDFKQKHCWSVYKSLILLQSTVINKRNVILQIFEHLDIFKESKFFYTTAIVRYVIIF